MNGGLGTDATSYPYLTPKALGARNLPQSRSTVPHCTPFSPLGVNMVKMHT